MELAAKIPDAWRQVKSTTEYFRSEASGFLKHFADFVPFLLKRRKEVDYLAGQDGREILGQKIYVFEGSTEQFPKLQKEIEKRWFKRYAYVVDVLQMVLDRYEGLSKEEAFEKACQDPEVEKIFNLHGWDSLNSMSRLDSAEPNKIDGELQQAIQNGVPAVVVSIDAAGWGKSELTELGKWMLRFGRDANSAVSRIKHGLDFLDMQISQLFPALTENAEENQEAITQLVQIRELFKFDTTSLFETVPDTNRSGIFRKVRNIFRGIRGAEKLSDLPTVFESALGRQVLQVNKDEVTSKISSLYEILGLDVPDLQLLQVADEDIPSDQVDATYAVFPNRDDHPRWRYDLLHSVLIMYRNIMTTSSFPEKWDMASLSDQADEQDATDAPGSPVVSAEALFLLMRDGLQLEGHARLVSHSQGEMLARIASQMMHLRGNWKDGKKKKFQITVIGQEGSMTDRDLQRENYNQHLLEIFRTPLGRKLVEVGDVTGLTTLVGYALTHYLGLYSGKENVMSKIARIPRKIANELAWIHAAQINLSSMPLLIWQSRIWANFVQSAPWGINGVSWSAADDELTPARRYLAWRESTRINIHAPMHHHAVFSDGSAISQEKTLPGPHYAHVIPENQSRVLDSLGEILRTTQLLEKSADVHNLLARRDDPALQNITFCVVQHDAQLEVAGLDFRIPAAYSQAKQHLAANTGLPAVVTLTEEELAGFISFVDLHEYGKNLAGEKTFTKKIIKERRGIGSVSNKWSGELPADTARVFGELISAYPLQLLLTKELPPREEWSESGDEEAQRIARKLLPSFIQWLDRQVHSNKEVGNEFHPNVANIIKVYYWQYIRDAVRAIIQHKDMNLLSPYNIPTEKFLNENWKSNYFNKKQLVAN